VLERLDRLGKVIGIDLDDDALAASRERLAQFGDHAIIVKENFRNIKFVLSQHGVNTVQGVLLDLGVSSFQIDESDKGFSFRADAQLDMRMDRHQQIDASRLSTSTTNNRLRNILWKYGEEKHARRIARAMVHYRIQHPIESTGQLAAIIERTVGGQFLNKTLARVFQAVRIEVNNEMENLRHAIRDCIDVLNPGGRSSFSPTTHWRIA